MRCPECRSIFLSSRASGGIPEPLKFQPAIPFPNRAIGGILPALLIRFNLPGRTDGGIQPLLSLWRSPCSSQPPCGGIHHPRLGRRYCWLSNRSPGGIRFHDRVSHRRALFSRTHGGIRRITAETVHFSAAHMAAYQYRHRHKRRANFQAARMAAHEVSKLTGFLLSFQAARMAAHLLIQTQATDTLFQAARMAAHDLVIPILPRRDFQAAHMAAYFT